jgi:hypothetical protein
MDLYVFSQTESSPYKVGIDTLVSQLLSLKLQTQVLMVET